MNKRKVETNLMKKWENWKNGLKTERSKIGNKE